MPDLMTPVQEWINTALAAIGGAAASFFALRRKYSQDTTAITRDRAESNLMVTLMTERDAAMRTAQEAWSQRTEDAKAIARFEALLEASERETKRLRDEIFSMRLHTRKLTAIIVRLDPQAAQMLQLDANGDGVEIEDRRSHPPANPA
jgi:hypothetical protein